jgi:hypothetical protein
MHQCVIHLIQKTRTAVIFGLELSPWSTRNVIEIARSVIGAVGPVIGVAQWRRAHRLEEFSRGDACKRQRGDHHLRAHRHDVVPLRSSNVNSNDVNYTDPPTELPPGTWLQRRQASMNYYSINT